MAPLGSIIDFSQSNLGWDLIKSLVNYYGLRDYLSFRYFETFYSEKIREIFAYGENPDLSGEEIFWQEVFTGHLLAGDKVRLRNFQISPWFPRKPGLYWTYDAALARRFARERHVERTEGNLVAFDIWGKALMAELGGVGTVNLRKNRDHVLITATASGYTERGIPVLCSKEIWAQIEESFRRDRMVEVDLEGTVESTPAEHDSFLLRSPGLPKIAVRIKSILNIKLKASRLSIVVTPWTLFETSRPNFPYGFTYMTHRLHEDDMDKSIQWLTDYIDRNQGTLILTDFDEETNSLNARFPLNGCLDGTVVSDDVLRYCQEIKKNFDRDRF